MLLFSLQIGGTSGELLAWLNALHCLAFLATLKVFLSVLEVAYLCSAAFGEKRRQVGIHQLKERHMNLQEVAATFPQRGRKGLYYLQNFRNIPIVALTWISQNNILQESLKRISN